ncbi:transcription initiation factor TFIID subunit 4 isoform X2 [Agrilus planipennis]|uniref:Transcription initiation factor TFIID subunit 4 isoform X2 n=1 Tax=Agrilus planipennis TaxID=224129 RepID=A0A1W4X8T6_AGRPL|nr:transcription initiation factor TFIID subunit 4 isoform X2 [Agrilus planipennis]
MASAKFLEEALRSDVDESAVNAIVGSLENQLVTSTPAVSIQSNTSIGINQNHINSAISNGGTVPSQKHGAIINGESIVSSATTADTNKLVVNNALSGTIITGAAAQVATGAVTTSYVNQVNNNNHNNNSSNSQTSKANDTGGGGGGVKVVFSQSGQTMTSAAAVLSNRVATFPTSQTIPNGTIGLSSLTPQTVLQTTTTNVQTIQAKQPTIVIKTSGAPAGSPGLVTLPMNVSPVPQVNNVGTPSSQSSTTVLSNLQLVNVRPGVPTQPQKGQPARVVLSAPQMVGARPGAPQLTLQSLHGLQPGQQGHLLLKTENGQYQLLRVGPAPGVATGLPASSVPGATTPVTFRMQAVPAGATAAPVSSPAPASGVTTVNNSAVPTVVQTATPVQRPANDNTKEKCRKFLANLLELSSREPKSVERSVRTLIQELIDMHVEPEDFCDRLERLLNASPQPCLIGFLKKSLPLLRHSLATKELSIDGIRPPPANVVFSIQSGTAAVATVSTQVRPAAVASSQVRLVAPGATVVRPAGAGHVVQQRLVTPVRGAVQQTTRMVATIRQPNSVATPVAVSSSQPPALHPVFPATNQVRATGATVVRQQPVQVRTPVAVRTAATPVQVKGTGASGTQAASQKSLGVSSGKPSVPSSTSKSSKDKDKKASFSASAAAAAYAGNVAGDDDINDVAAMGGVNLAEETQKILGSTEFVGTQIRSCKEDVLLNMGPLQQKLRQVMQKHGLDEPSNEVVACVSHAVQERLKNLIEKLSIITEHRLEMVKTDQRYEVTSDIKGQLKFLEDLDRAERKRHEELEREMLLRAAKSRSKTEDPEQAKLKAKAKEMQRVEMEELRQREANATALQAIGPRKKPRLDGDASAGSSQTSTGSFHSGARGQLPLRARMKKVTLRDLQFLFETEKDLCKSPLLYKSYLK